MTGVDAIKEAVSFYHRILWVSVDHIPPYIHKLCDVVYKLRREVFNWNRGMWEDDEGF